MYILLYVLDIICWILLCMHYCNKSSCGFQHVVCISNSTREAFQEVMWPSWLKDDDFLPSVLLVCLKSGKAHGNMGNAWETMGKNMGHLWKTYGKLWELKHRLAFSGIYEKTWYVHVHPTRCNLDIPMFGHSQIILLVLCVYIYIFHITSHYISHDGPWYPIKYDINPHFADESAHENPKALLLKAHILGAASYFVNGLHPQSSKEV